MKVSAATNIRYRSDKTIFDHPILNVVIEEDGTYRSHKPQTLCIKKTKRDGSIHITVTAPQCRDNYHLYMDFTEDEVIKIFLECFPQFKGVMARLMSPPTQGPSEPITET